MKACFSCSTGCVEIIVFVKGAIHKTNALKRKGIVKSHSLTDWVYKNIVYFS